MSDTTTTITPEERANLRRVVATAELCCLEKIPFQHSDITRLLNALEAADGLAIKLKADIDAGAKDYCTLMDKHYAQFVRAEQVETESAKLRGQVSALLDLNDVGMELLDACLDACHAEAEAVSASTETRLKGVRASLFAAYDKATKARERCEALGLTVTPCQQGAHDA